MLGTGNNARGSSLALLVALLVALVPASCGDGGRERPNVLWISIDTLRADHLGCYGYPRPTSPNLDRLAREGVLFERAVAPTSWTLPSHVSMLTGLDISAHGACDERLWARKDVHGRHVKPPLRGRSIAESLRDAGYATAGFYTFSYLSPTFGFGAGFDTWERLGHNLFSQDETRVEFQALRAANDVPAIQAFLDEHADLLDARRRSTPEIVERANRWVTEHAEQRGDDPFFLFLHLFDVHDPYTPTEAFDRFGDPDYAGTVDGRITGEHYPLRAGVPPRADREELVALYDGGIAFVDDQLERVFARLRELELEDDTLVVLTSDHGEEFFEHADAGHRRQLYIESLHVPLILRWPGRLPAGRRVSGTVGLADIAPTILAATGARRAHAMTGTDLLPFARGEQTNSGRMYVGMLHLFERGSDGIERAIERQVSLFRGDEHILVTYCPNQAFRAERYDLSRDPRELGPPTVFHEHDRAGIELAKQFDSIRLGRAALRARLPRSEANLEAMTARQRSALASSGYVSSEALETSSSERLCMDGCVFWR